MPKLKKTKKQKIAISEKKAEQLTYSFSSEGQTRAPEVQHKTVEQFSSLFRYDATLIYKDLFKTCVISFILIASLVGISLYLQ